MMGTQLTLNLQRALAAIARQQDHLASGRRVLGPSDDPAAAAQVLLLRSRQAAIVQYQRNLAAARASLLEADAVVQSVVDLATQAREAAVQGANDTNDALARDALGARVDQFLEVLVEHANRRGGGGTYLLGGQEATVAPYAVVRDAGGRIVTVTPNPRGIDGDVPAEVSEDLVVSMTVSGTAVFGPATDATYAFDVLVRLRDALQANQPAGIQAALDELGTVIDRGAAASVTVGTRLDWLGLVDDRLAAEAVGLAATLSRVEDLDVPGAIGELQKMQLAYEAALASGARLIEQSLLDFLR
jgi:flagellar hook-associated protein 3 FlgL